MWLNIITHYFDLFYYRKESVRCNRSGWFRLEFKYRWHGFTYVYGCPDETYNFPTGLKKANEYNLRNFADYDFLATLVHFDRSSPNYSDHYLDTEYDIFSYSVGSHSGSFVLKENQPVMLNAASPVRINTGGAYTTSITDENGTTYLFDNPEYIPAFLKDLSGN